MEKSSHDLSEVLSQHYLRGAEDKHEESQDNQCHGGDKNRAPLKWKSEGL